MMKKIPLDELEFGMYVNELDCPWTDTPFVFQGFFLKTPEQMEVLRRFCKHVFVDTERVVELEAGRSTASMPMSSAPRLAGTGRVNYQVSATVETEFARARDVYASSEEVVSSAVESIHKGGMQIGRAHV